MVGALRALFVIIAVLFAQHASLLHGLAHAQQDLALAAKGGKAPALGHGTEVCAAFGALAHGIGCAVSPSAPTVGTETPVAHLGASVFPVIQAAFAPRGPPTSS